MTHTTAVEQAETGLTSALAEHLNQLMDHEATRLHLDDSPTLRVVRLHLVRSAA